MNIQDWFPLRLAPVAQVVKNPPAMGKTLVLSLGWEDPLEEGMTTHSSIFAWKSPWIEEPGRLQSFGLQRLGHDWATKHSTAQEKDKNSLNGNEITAFLKYET